MLKQLTPPTEPTTMKRHYLNLLAAAVSLSFATAPTFAAEKERSSEAGKAAPADVMFVKTAAGDGMAEVVLGELAQQKAEAPAVKQFGQSMVTDHTKANDELKALASSKGIDLPAHVPKKHQATADTLSKLSGAEFDKAYAAQMVKDHEKAVADFENASRTAQDRDIKAFAAKILPTLQHHLEMARTLSGGGKQPTATK
jgi:putative membrane protein